MRDLGEELLVVESAKAGEPDEAVDEGSVEQGNAVSDGFIAAAAPSPSDGSEVAAEKPAGK